MATGQAYDTSLIGPARITRSSFAGNSLLDPARSAGVSGTNPRHDITHCARSGAQPCRARYADRVVDSLPLFPLPSVLFPGVVLPLHVFEERYRVLVQRLLEMPDGRPRRFGVVAIRQGQLGEGGSSTPEDIEDPDSISRGRSERAVGALHPVGCTAELRQVDNRDDGTYEIVTVGVERFALHGVDATTEPYLVGEVEMLPAQTESGPEVDLLAQRAGALFEEYVTAVAAIGGAEVAAIELPDEPDVLSYLVASTALLTVEDKQSLLEQDSTRDRLRAEIRLLRRETVLVRELRVVPAPLSELGSTPGRN